jgi:hypothetical protein
MNNTESDVKKFVNVILNNNGLRSHYARNERIHFAYDYYSTIGDIDTLTLLKESFAGDKEDTKTIMCFLTKQSISKKLCENSEYIIPRANLSAKSFDGFANIDYETYNWLSKFDEKLSFEKRGVHLLPAIPKILKQDGQEIEIDRTTARNIAGIIIDNGIYPAKCIVEGAYKPYADGNLDDYFDKVTHEKKLILK